jgi:hypothetical protein
MVDFFGREKAADYPNFIEAYIKEGKEKVFERWLEKVSVYQPSK